MSAVLRRSALLLWELPQNLLGVARLATLALSGHVTNVRFEKERLFVEIVVDGAVSLGLFVFFTSRDNKYVPVGPENKDHEYGHSIQSRWLGPLYLPIVGVPSTIRGLYAFAHRHIAGRRWGGYYDGFPE